MLRLKVGLLLISAVVMGTLVILNWGHVNGPSYWPWAWRPVPPAQLYSLMVLASLPFFAAQAMNAWSRRSVVRGAALALIMLCSFGLRLASVATRSDVTGQPSPDLGLIRIIVQDPNATSYYPDAVTLGRSRLCDWLGRYPAQMQTLNLHSKTKPPGPILYWLLPIRLLGDGPRAQLTGGLLLGAIATFSIPATYLFLRFLFAGDCFVQGESNLAASHTRPSDAAFHGAAFLSLCPGFLFFFPMFDPTYILLTTALLGCWLGALRRQRPAYSILLGLVLAATCFITFNVLVLGLFMIAMVFIVGAPDRPFAQRFATAARHAAIALATAVAVLAIFKFTIGYDPFATFISAWRNQHQLLIEHASERPWPRTIFFDLTDFALGSGWISVLLVVYAVFDRRQAPSPQRGRCLAWIGAAMAQIVTVAALGLLQAETARVWNFMLPLPMIPIGLELSRWPAAARTACYVGLLFVAAAIAQNMKFIY